MDIKLKETKIRWNELKKSSRFHNFLLFLLFVAIATLFWFIMLMNDNVEDTFTLRLNIYNKPDSLTYINEPPTKISVTVRDRGTQLLRNGFGRSSTFDLNFREFAYDGLLRVSNTQLYAAIRNRFGGSAQILSMSVDSLHIEYTSLPGKRVPIDVNAEVSASLGNVISGKPSLSQNYVTVYSTNHRLLDTITRVFTEKVVLDNLSETSTFSAKLLPIPGARITPGAIQIKIPVEALVNKTFAVNVTPVNVPPESNMLLFPATVELEGYIPMSRFNHGVSGISVEANYDDAVSAAGNKIAVRLTHLPSYMTNVVLKTDSVEYTIVKSN